MSSVLSNRTDDFRGDVQADASCRRGVLLINLGTPDLPDVQSVRRYLGEFLSDPYIIRLPRKLGWLNGVIGRLIARFRASKSAEMYQSIWTDQGSPLEVITREQVAALQNIMPKGWRVFHAMRYGQPGIAETIREVEASGIDELVVVPMYPQFSGPTTGTALRQLYEAVGQDGLHVNVTTRSVWYDDGGYVNAQAKLLHEYIRAHGLTPDNAFLVFSAHGLPVSYVKRGDPYPRHVHRTIGLVLERLGWPTERASVAYQSRFGPAEWLKPATDERLVELARSGEKRIVVCSVSFTTDCLETLEEIDVRYRELAAEHGADLFLCPALNTYPPFISALKELVLRGSKSVTSWGEKVRPLMKHAPDRTKTDGHIDSLVMVGMSLANRIGNGTGPQLNHTDPDGLRQAKISQCQVPRLLKAIHDQGGLQEALLWNTCNRFELYGWLDEPADPAKRELVVSRLRQCLFNENGEPNPSVNVLYGAQAWHHLLRTAAGLNSQLPGEREIVEQLHAAQRLAECAGVSGPLSQRLLTDVKAMERDLRSQTTWSRFDPDYCLASLTRTAAAAKLDLSECRGVVIGGSTTSAGVLRTLIGQFEVPSRQLTLLYRGHKKGGHVKLLRKAIGNGRRVRVQSYTEPQVLRAVTEADVVVFGLDSEKPVLDGEQLRGCRDFAAKPLTIIDFNMFGSTTGMDTVDGVTLYTAKRLEAEVAAFADEMCSSEEFNDAVEAAEAWICEQVCSAAASGQSEGDRRVSPALDKIGAVDSGGDPLGAGSLLSSIGAGAGGGLADTQSSVS